jgi:DNA-binding CsgD family transcriptional regulator
MAPRNGRRKVMTRQERWAQLARDLTRVDTSPSLDLAPHLLELRALLGAQNTIFYNPECTHEGWDLELSVWTGEDAEARRSAHRQYVRRSVSDEPRFAAYDPFAVQPEQRNRALTVEGICAVDSQANATHRRLWAAIGAKEHEDQIRTLLCRGPRLLGWLGAVRDRPFDREDERRFASLTEAFRARLLTEGAARTRLPQIELVDGLLAAIREPALLLGKWGHVEAANAAGLRLIDEARSPLLPSLREALAHGKRHPAFALTRLESRGFPEYVLALYIEQDFAQAAQVAAACRKWLLSGRRAAVLEKVVAGRSNKEVAQELGCAEVTVERYLTSLFRATGTRSRTELLARVLVKSPHPPSS